MLKTKKKGKKKKNQKPAPRTRNVKLVSRDLINIGPSQPTDIINNLFTLNMSKITEIERIKKRTIIDDKIESIFPEEYDDLMKKRKKDLDDDDDDWDDLDDEDDWD